ncbi:hypothetical protein ACVNPS_01735 [Candidatus Bipolaricaulota sp. J31]
MKRALAFTFAALLFGVAGLAQISGSWSGTLDLLPFVGFSSTLKLTYSVAGFDITSTSVFGTSWTSQSFTVSGAFGPVDVSGSMKFDPSGPAYVSTKLDTSLDFAGIALGLSVFHTVDTDDYTYCQTTSKVEMVYTITASVDPISLEVNFVDCCDGIEFADLTLELSDLSLCCGIVYDFELYFKKTGFEYVLFSIDKLFELCCGISFGVDVKFGTTYKSVTPSFSWDGITGCVTVWGDLQLKDPEVGVEGWELGGYKIYCELSECTYLEFVHVFDPTIVPSSISDRLKSYTVDDITVTEDEWIEAGFCGPACCGGTWDVTVAVYFDAGAGYDLLFGITRFDVSATVPIMDSLSLSIDYTYAGLATNPVELSVGWKFTF